MSDDKWNVVAEHDQPEMNKLVEEMPPDPTDERIGLMLEIAYSIGRRTGYGEAVETATKHMTLPEDERHG